MLKILFAFVFALLSDVRSLWLYLVVVLLLIHERDLLWRRERESEVKKERDREEHF